MKGQNAFHITDAPLLAERTSIRIGGRAIAEVRVMGRDGLEQLPGLVTGIGGRVAFLGLGTNILAHDGNLPLVLVTQEPVDETRVIGEDGSHVFIKADAATRLPSLLAKAASLGLSGLEGLTGIPGTVGGAVAMNAGSYGAVTGDLVYRVEVFSPVLGLVERTADDFDFTYRSCRLHDHPGWFVVNSATFALNKGSRLEVRARMREVYEKKKTTQPVAAHSAGCIFKNPDQSQPAGRLLEQAGMKGLRLGGMSFSSVHANFLVNDGNGTFDQAADLIELARDKVHKNSGHSLQLEVHIWP